jgi:uncharacterized protein (TIGR00251 family)
VAPIWCTARSEYDPNHSSRAGRSTPMRVEVHVHPGSRHASVGGTYDGALVVRVRARAVDGAATSEVLDAVADAFHVRTAVVQLVRGRASRRKVLTIEGDDQALEHQLSLLLDATDK